MQMHDVLIECRAICKDYDMGGEVIHALRDVSLTISRGEYVAIMGPSGSGKSTLMNLIGALDVPTRGDLVFDGLNLSQQEPDRLADFRNRTVGFVFQQFNLLPKTSVFDNVKLPLIYSQKNNKNKLVMEAIKSVGLEHRAKYLSNQLSGGEKQRVAIARAIVNDPQIIFADEPTGNLDSKTGTQIMNIFEKLNSTGRTIILVTHELDTAQHAKRIIKLKDGVISEDIQVSKRHSSMDRSEEHTSELQSH